MVEGLGTINGRGVAWGTPIEGLVTMNVNHHISKTVRIGQVRDDGLFNIVWSTKKPIAPVPWNQFVPATKGFSCDWSDPNKGGKFKT